MSFQNIIVVIMVLIFAFLSFAKGIRTIRRVDNRNNTLKWYKDVNILLFIVLINIAFVLAISPIAKTGSVFFFLMLFFAIVGFLIALPTAFLVIPTWWSGLTKGKKN